MRPPQTHENKDLTVMEYAPITLFPSPIPEPLWRQAKSIQRHYNRLMHQVAHDHEFLAKCLEKYVLFYVFCSFCILLVDYDFFKSLVQTDVGGVGVQDHQHTKSSCWQSSLNISDLEQYNIL